MKAFGYDHSGDPSVFQEYDIDTPEISDNQVLIKTVAIGLNNYDRSQRAGAMGPSNGRTIPGRDSTGTVEKIGSNVTGFKVGDRVAAQAGHSYAEYVAANESSVAHIPDNVSFNEAVGIITSGTTAYNIVHTFGNIKSEQTIIVQGASGGVGSIVTQLAVDLGAKVIGIASSKNEQLVKSYGVAKFVAYDKENPAETLKNTADVVVNGALNGAGGESDAEMVKPGGTIATVGFAEPETNKQITFNHVHRLGTVHASESLGQLLDLMGKGKLSIKIGYKEPFTLNGFIKGHKILDEKHSGRVIVTKES